MSAASNPPLTAAPGDRADRLSFAVIAGMSAFLGLLTVADGIWRTVALAAGVGPVELIAGGDLPSADVGRISAATVTSEAVGEGSRALLVTASAIDLLVMVAIFAAIVVFQVMTGRGTPFHRFVFPVVLTAGLAMTFGGMLAAGIDGLGRTMAGGDLGAPYEMAFELRFGPRTFGFVVLVVAYVLRTGQRLQRDSEGLV